MLGDTLVVVKVRLSTLLPAEQAVDGAAPSGESIPGSELCDASSQSRSLFWNLT